MNNIILETVRDLRRNQTKAEKIFWSIVRNRKIKNRKFVRQFAIIFDFEDGKRFFVADFYCNELKFIIEIDGKIHDNQKEYDSLRTYILNNLGFQVLRFRNEDVLFKLEKVIKELENYL
jgi:very-short-patch-repair endonuclease